jgi:hypothetical protein
MAREELVHEVRRRAAELRRLAHIIAIAPLDMFSNDELGEMARDLRIFCSPPTDLNEYNRKMPPPDPIPEGDDGEFSNSVGVWAYSIMNESDQFNDWDAQYDFSKVI